jgi:hypothetical protein
MLKRKLWLQQRITLKIPSSSLVFSFLPYLSKPKSIKTVKNTYMKKILPILFIFSLLLGCKEKDDVVPATTLRTITPPQHSDTGTYRGDLYKNNYINVPNHIRKITKDSSGNYFFGGIPITVTDSTFIMNPIFHADVQCSAGSSIFHVFEGYGTFTATGMTCDYKMQSEDPCDRKVESYSGSYSKL